MRKFLAIFIAVASIIFLAMAAVAYAAPTSTIVQNLTITGVKSAPCLGTDGTGLAYNNSSGCSGGSPTGTPYVSGNIVIASGTSLITYAGSLCGGLQFVTGISASGTVSCATPSGGGGSSTVNLAGSSTAFSFPYWLDANGNLTGSSSIYSQSNGDITVGGNHDFGPFGAFAPLGYFNLNGTPTTSYIGVPTSTIFTDASGTPIIGGNSPYVNTQTGFANPNGIMIDNASTNGSWIAGGSGSLATSSSLAPPPPNGSGTALYLTTSGGATVDTINNASDGGPWNFTGKYVELWMYINTSTPMTEMRFVMTSNHSFSSSAGQTATWKLEQLQQGDHYGDYFQAGQWTRVILPFDYNNAGGSFTSTSTFNQSAVNGFELIGKDNGTSAVTEGIGGIAMVNQMANPIDSFTFDNGYASNYTLAAPLLAQYGFAGDSFEIPTRQWTGPYTGVGGYMTTQQMQLLQNLDGWDIDCHTTDHPTAVPGVGNYTQQQLWDQYSLCKQYLNFYGIGAGSNILAWPIGDYSPLAEAMAQTYFVMSRGINGKIPEVAPPGNPYDLRAIEWTATTPTSSILTQLQNCKNNDEWCIIELHEVTSSTPSSEQISTTTLAYALSQTSALGLQVKTLNEVLKSYQSPILTATSTLYGIQNQNTTSGIVEADSSGNYFTIATSSYLATFGITATTSDYSATTVNGATTFNYLASSTWYKVANNLSELTNTSTARTNLGLGSAATHNTGDFAQTANNLSDLASTSTARTNLGLKATSSLALADANGFQTSYGGSSCAAGNVVSQISATGTVICVASSTLQATHSITVTTSTLTYSTILNATNTIVTVVNTSTLTTIYSFTVPGGSLGSGRVIRINAGGAFFNNSAISQSLTFGMTYGGTTVLAGGSSNVATSSSPGIWVTNYSLFTSSSTSNEIGREDSLITAAATLNNAKGGSAAVDSTANQTLTLTLKWTNADPNLSANVENVTLSLDGATTTIVTGTTYN